jgi:hypothetical protein
VYTTGMIAAPVSVPANSQRLMTRKAATDAAIPETIPVIRGLFMSPRGCGFSSSL